MNCGVPSISPGLFSTSWPKSVQHIPLRARRLDYVIRYCGGWFEMRQTFFRGKQQLRVFVSEAPEAGFPRIHKNLWLT